MAFAGTPAARNDMSSIINQNAEIISHVVVFSSISTAALSLRLLSRRVKKADLHIDDYLAIASWLVTLAEGITIACSIRFAGLGRHASGLTTKQIVAFKKGLYALLLLQPTALSLGKLSILFLLHRIFVTRKFQLTMRILGAMVIAWYLSTTLLAAFRCSPIRSNWDPSVHANCRVNYRLLGLISPIPWVLTDFAILMAPMPMILKLQIPRTDKIELALIFLTGGLTCVVAVYFYSIFNHIQLSDITWDNVKIAYCCIIETNVTVTCACIGVVKPALQYLYPSNLFRRHGRVGRHFYAHGIVALSVSGNLYLHCLLLINMGSEMLDAAES